MQIYSHSSRDKPHRSGLVYKSPQSPHCHCSLIRNLDVAMGEGQFEQVSFDGIELQESLIFLSLLKATK